MLPQQPEEADVTYEQLLMKSHQSKKDVTKASHDSIATRIWKRLPGQVIVKFKCLVSSHCVCTLWVTRAHYVSQINVVNALLEYSTLLL